MAISSWNAGIIRPVAVAPAGPYQDGAAPGVWTLDQQAFWQKQGLWPLAGNVAQIALFAGGNTSGNVIDKVIIQSAGNAVDFGDLTVARAELASCSSSVRGLWAGGSASGNVIDFVTMASSGNATDFGDLTELFRECAGLSNYVRGVFANGLALRSTTPGPSSV